MKELINIFQKEKSCEYKGEKYSVRDNGAVYRCGKANKRKRPLDEVWTFGRPNNNGYMLISGEVVSRIVATAFHGEPTTWNYVADHIDTNRQNNRPENLRWLTKLENILKNEVTVKRIIYYCGSIDAFLEDPSILRNHIKKDPNFDWMKTVTSEEAKISWSRLSNWAKNVDTSTSSTGDSMGEWIYKHNQYFTSFQKPSEFVTSLTPKAVQKDWKTPSEFPCCPQDNSDNPIQVYAKSLKEGKIFSLNQYSNSIIEDFATSKDGNTLWVVCRSSNDSAIKPWSLAEVTFENHLFVHANLGSFFKKDGVVKYFTLAQGLEWAGGDTFDDFC